MNSTTTMHLPDLLLTLEYEGIELSVKNGALGYRAPPGSFTDALLEQVKHHKQDLISLIEQGSARIESQLANDGVTDELPLTPWHGWYLETFDPVEHRWSVTRHVQLGEEAGLDVVEAAVRSTMNRYDTFRQRLHRKPDGAWVLRMLSTAGEPKIILCDANESAGQWKIDVQKDIERTLSMVDGPVIYVALCKNHREGDSLVISLHHNIVDAYSVGYIVDDLMDTYRRLSANQDAHREIKAEYSYESYARKLHNYMSGSMFFARSMSYWRDVIATATPRIPMDFAGGRHTASNTKIVKLHVGRDVFSSKNTSLVNDSLLVAAIAAIADWSGEALVAIDVEHHGRGGHAAGMDFLEVIGPTTFKFPLWLEIGPDCLSSPAAFESLRRRVTDVTQYGLGYGFLRYLHPDHGIRSDFQKMERPQVFFNNRTTLFPKSDTQEMEGAAQPRASGVFRIEAHGDPDLHDPYSHELLIECDGAPDGIEVSLIYSGQIHTDQTVVRLASALLAKLRQISASCV